MIEEPPLLTIKRPTRRPTQAQIDAFQDVPTGFVVDAMLGGGTLDARIKPLGDHHIAGPALTADSGPADILALLASLAHVTPGDVVVNAFGGHQGCASVGDRVSAMLQNCGAAGIVTDGPARDLAGITQVGLPVWCTGLTPNTPHGNGPGRVGLPVQIGGQQVDTGDMIVADTDGVVVVPFDQIDTVIAAVEKVRELEAALDAEVQNGQKIPPAIQELLASDKVKYL